MAVRKATFCLNDYDAYGFDLDHTLAKYNLVEVIQLSYESVIDFLVKNKGYPPSIRLDITKHKDFICKGLFIDAEKGNVIKLSHGGKIFKACHGSHMLTAEELNEAYGDGLIWEHFKEAREAAQSRAASGSFMFWENYFDIPAILACCSVVEHLDKQNGGPLESYRSTLWEDVLGGLQHNYRFQAFAENSGYFFPKLKETAEKIYQPSSDGVKQWLKDLRKSDKIVFLMTSSHIDFASLTAQSVLGPEWRSYFDIVITNGRKPGFFKDRNPFLALEGVKETLTLDWSDLQPNQIFSSGNQHDLEKFITKQTGKRSPKIVYFGDSLCSDAFPVKSMAGWDVGLVLEEMEAEGYHPDHNTHHYWSPAEKETKFVRKVNLDVDPDEETYLLSETWGSFFYHPEEDPEHNRHMNTFWGELITKYCDIAIPSMEYIAGLPLDHKFPTFNHAEDGNTDGFSPAPPKPLLNLSLP